MIESMLRSAAKTEEPVVVSVGDDIVGLKNQGQLILPRSGDSMWRLRTAKGRGKSITATFTLPMVKHVLVPNGAKKHTTVVLNGNFLKALEDEVEDEE